MFPQGPPKPETVPFLKEFRRILETEWAHPTLPKHKTKLWSKFCSPPDGVSQVVAVPTVDPPVVALSSAAITPSEGEGGLKMLPIKGKTHFSSAILWPGSSS